LRTGGILLLLVAGIAAAGAGTARAQTPFSLRAVGQPLANDDARMVARGGWGMAATDSMHPGFKNIASLAAIKHVALSFTAYGESAENRDQRDSRRTSRTVSPNIRVALPVVKERFALTAGFQIYRSTQYTTLIADTLFAQVWEDDIRGDYRFRREGNQFRVPLGAAVRVLPFLSVSGAFNLENGSLREELSQEYLEPFRPGQFQDLPSYLTDLREERHEFNGGSYTFGAILHPFPWFQAGAAWTPGYDLDVERRLTHLGVTGSSRTEYTMSVPDEYQGGVQLEFGRWRAGGDLRAIDYREFAGRDDWLEQMEQEFAWSVGLERKRARIRRGGLNNLPLRLGYMEQQWGYRVSGEEVVERVYSVGTGFPFRGNLGQLDVAFSYGRIGERERNLMESEYLRLTISVTGLERWW
jgi:hypothetical protein